MTDKQILKLARKHLSVEEINACYAVAFNQLDTIERIDVENAMEAIKNDDRFRRGVGDATAREMVGAIGIALQ